LPGLDPRCQQKRAGPGTFSGPLNHQWPTDDHWPSVSPYQDQTCRIWIGEVCTVTKVGPKSPGENGTEEPYIPPKLNVRTSTSGVQSQTAQLLSQLCYFPAMWLWANTFVCLLHMLGIVIGPKHRVVAKIRVSVDIYKVHTMCE
jgi:hypothetical protein